MSFLASENARPLQNIKVVEFAGLAPGPFVGMVLADFGANVIRIDKTGATFNPDSLCRGKRSLAVSPKHPQGRQILTKLIQTADVIIDPFRPGVLERLGLGPQDLHNEIDNGLVFARLSGFQREGPYSRMAGHDINYIALSGVLSMLGQAGGPPQPPANLLGDFAGGSMVCVLGVLLALLERSKSSKGQVVEADMVTGARYVSSFLLMTSYLAHPAWGPVVNDGRNETRGQNTLDGGAPWYGVYQCKDGSWMSVGAIEPQFYKQLLEILKTTLPDAPLGSHHPSPETQHDRKEWPRLQKYFTACFAQLTRHQWEQKFIDTDACVVPVLTRDEAALEGIVPAAKRDNVADGNPIIPSPAPKLSRTPAIYPAASPGGDWEEQAPQLLLTPGEHTEDILLELGIATDGEERNRLYREQAIDGPDGPTFSAKPKL